MTGSPTTKLDDRLLEILRCPACRGEFAPPVEREGEGPVALVCTSCALRYPVRNGVPVLLVDEATRG